MRCHKRDVANIEKIKRVDHFILMEVFKDFMKERTVELKNLPEKLGFWQTEVESGKYVYSAHTVYRWVHLHFLFSSWPFLGNLNSWNYIYIKNMVIELLQNLPTLFVKVLIFEKKKEREKISMALDIFLSVNYCIDFLSWDHHRWDLQLPISLNRQRLEKSRRREKRNC